MSEEAPVNTGAVVWPDPDSAALAVRRMQTKLHHWAGADASRRFSDLYNLVYDPAFLVHAWERVASNAGARTPGIDRATVARIETWVGVEEFLGQIRDALKSGQFRPVAVRQVMIPKGTSGKLRKLGIPTVADRVVQATLKAVLEPIFETDFKPCSYGFRPNRRAHDAIAEIHYWASKPRNYQWTLEADIEACFDQISHTALMDRLRVRINDKRVCALVKAFLKSGVMTASGDREETLTGTPQGGILSPLLANIALSVLDEHFDRQWQEEMGSQWQRTKRRRNGQGLWKLVRFADDFVLMVAGERHHAEALREEVAVVLAPVGLRLSPEKTRVVHIDEGFDFLGFHIRRKRKRGTQKHFVYTMPSRKAVQSVKDKVKAKTYRSTRHMELDELLVSLNRQLRGWANYFRHAASKSAFNAIDSLTWGRIMRWIRHKYRQGRRGLGMNELRRRFCDRGWRFAHNGEVFTGASSVSVIRYRYRGNTIPTPWPLRQAALAAEG
ncbi:group II intron reverse transcriptase/maturase [Streptomyces sp. HNM0663]|uniref:Group II intron reverse transcriptase/maturase n=1 Tax=Streptomyces chengmaiensis TaxID=3040919 RepID=A0ABT6HZH5_9ACTN|nr:group II intron reverse transcriptase/maturase [Streptomyces chengmaiensis]MDH2394025.1 group II intron reverse transcriptase/maturase [Streptomyces chengmaiensis]